MIVSWAVAAPSALVFIWAKNWLGLIPGVIMYYCFSGMPAFNAYLAASTPKERQASAFSTVYASGPLGMMLASALGGYLADSMGMNVVFLISFVANLTATFALLPLRRQIPGTPERLAATPAASKPAPVVSTTSLVVYYSMFGLGYVLILASFPYVPTFVQEFQGFDMTQIGVMGSVTAASGLVCMLLLGVMGDKRGKTSALATALVVFGLGHAILIAPGGLPVVLLAYVMMGTSRAVQSLMTAMVTDLNLDRALGRGFGAFGAVTGIAAIVAPCIGGWIYSVAPIALFVSLSVAAGLLAIGAQLVDKFRRRDLERIRYRHAASHT